MWHAQCTAAADVMVVSYAPRTTYSNKSTVIEPSLDRVLLKMNRDLLHSKQVHLLGHLLMGSPVDSCCSVGIQGA